MRNVLLMLLCCVMFAGVANAQLVALHEDDNDPLTEGWSTFRGPVNTGPISSMGLDAWQVEDTGGDQEGGYEVALSGQNVTDALANGWKLTARVRTPNSSQPLNDAILAGVNFGSSGFIIRFGTDSGTPLVDFLAGPSGDLTGLDDGWHLYEVIYDPGTATADLFVDGTEEISDFAGWNGSFLGGTVSFGSGAGGADGNGYYNLVQFEIVPEPMTLTLLGLGGLMTLRRKRR